MDLEDKVHYLKLRISKLKFELKEIFEERTEQEKSIFIFDNNSSYLLLKKDKENFKE